jgi:antitoxin (DNA-binding transcriptional repressor) of toxin-antitoxin stability system
MKTATITQVRNDFDTVLHWIADGEEVTVLKRTRPVARILPPRPAMAVTCTTPDFDARIERIFGDRRTHVVDAFLRERE